MITEGVIPIAARDLLRVVGSCVVASAVAGGLIMVWGVESPVPHGGMFVVPLFTHPLLFCLALGIGTVICGVMLSLWKKPVTERDEEFDELSDQKLKRSLSPSNNRRPYVCRYEKYGDESLA